MAVVKGFQRKELIKFGHPVMKLPDITYKLILFLCKLFTFVSENAIAKKYYNTISIIVFVGVL